MGYKDGDMVVYPRNGAAKVEDITEQTVKGITHEYLQLPICGKFGVLPPLRFLQNLTFSIFASVDSRSYLDMVKYKIKYP